MNKSHIIAEIQRTAAANGGVPLGATRFETETGIKNADWFGVHWARWGDALREAGFDANQMKGAFDTDHLLKKLAELALELGRIPVRGDLKLKRRNDPDFPSWNTFDRLGTKAELVERLAEFSRRAEGFGPIVGWCEKYAPSADLDVDEDEPDGEVIGCVYLFKSGRFHKIGKSNAPGRREYELGIQLPERIETVHVIRTDDPAGIEEYWHKRFAAKRKNGEWFDLDAADVRAFKRRRFM